MAAISGGRALQVRVLVGAEDGRDRVERVAALPTTAARETREGGVLVVLIVVVLVVVVLIAPRLDSTRLLERAAVRAPRGKRRDRVPPEMGLLPLGCLASTKSD